MTEEAPKKKKNTIIAPPTIVVTHAEPVEEPVVEEPRYSEKTRQEIEAGRASLAKYKAY